MSTRLVHVIGFMQRVCPQCKHGPCIPEYYYEHEFTNDTVVGFMCMECGDGGHTDTSMVALLSIT